MKLPLSHRLPNAPAVFVGRSRELARFEEALGRAPVVLVVGDGGMGKSALVRAGLCQAQRDDEEQLPTVLVEVRPGDTFTDALVSLGKLLRLASGGEGGSDAGVSTDAWRAPSDPTELVGDVLDWAESGGWNIVIEDLHHDAGDPSPLVELIAAYASQSRWILTTRRALEVPALVEQSVYVGPLEPVAARNLATECGAEASDIEGLLHTSHGSPLVIRQGASGAATVASIERLPRSVVPLLKVLATLRQPLTTDVLSRLVGAMPASADMQALQRAGWLEEGSDAPGRVTRMHDVVRERFAENVSLEERRDMAERAAEVLPELGEGALIEAISGALESGLTTRALQLLEAHGEMLLVEGRGAWLWRLLAVAAPEFGGWALRAAIVVGSPETLAWANQQPSPQTDEDLQLWLEAQIQSGGYDVVLEHTESGRLTHLAPAQQAAALVKRGRALLVTGRVDDALLVLEDVRCEDPYTEAYRDAYLAKALMLKGDYRRATSLMRALQPRVEKLPPLQRDAVDVERTQVAVALGGQREVEPLFGLGSPSGTGRRRAHLLSAINHLLSGDRVEVEKALSNVEALGSPFDRIVRRLISALLDALDGDAVAAHKACAAAIEEVVGSNIGAFLPWAEAAAEMIGRLLDQRWEPMTGPPGGMAPPLVKDLVLINDYIRELETRPCGQWPELPTPAGRATQQSFVDTLLEIGWSRIHFIRSEYVEADLFCTTALRRAVETGWGLVHVVALMTRVPLLAGLGKREVLATALVELEAVGASVRSKLVEDWIAFWRVAIQPQPKFKPLLKLAQTGAPPAQRLARAVLSAAAPDGAYAARCYAVTKDSWSDISVVRAGGASKDWSSTWILDLCGKQVLDPNGQTLSLARQTIGLRLLSTIAKADGAADKETLATGVWELAEYHPIRDDNRLHVSVNRLRKLLQRLPGATDLLASSAEGYSLNPDLSIVVVSRSGDSAQGTK